MEYNPAELILSELASTLGLGLVQMKEIMSRLAERPDNDIFELILYARLLPQPAPAVPGKNIARSSLHILVLMFFYQSPFFRFLKSHRQRQQVKAYLRQQIPQLPCSALPCRIEHRVTQI